MSLPVSRSAAAASAATAAQPPDTGPRLAGWLAAAARGDSDAFESFYDATIGHARALARRMLQGAELDDALADAYFEAWRHAARYDADRGNAIAWLLTIVRSRALDLLRQRRSHPVAAGSDDGDEVAESATDPAHDPSERLWQSQAGSRLHSALHGLSIPERWVLGLAYFRDLTHAEIAQCTGMPLGTVKSHSQRAQTKLRAALGG